MKTLNYTLTGLMTLALLPNSWAAPKDDLTNAAKKLADKNYSWTTTTENAGSGGGGGGQRGGGPVQGKTEKDGFTFLTMSFGENNVEAAMKGEKSAIKTQEGWRSSEEAAAAQGDGGQRGRGNFGRNLRNFKAPAAEAQGLIEKATDLKQEGDVYSGTLTEEGAKELVRVGRGGRGGGGGANAPQPTGAKGTVKFWVKDGVLSKYEYNVQGKMTVGQDQAREIEVNRTTTVQIKDVGTTKVEVPEEAKKKLS
jgi:hypothetical protein